MAPPILARPIHLCHNHKEDIVPGTDSKAHLRQVARDARRGAFLRFADRMGVILTANFMARFSLGPDQVIAGYWPVDEEADTRALMTALAERGHIVALPKVARAGVPLRFIEWRPGDPLHPGYKGILEPDGAGRDVFPDTILVPLLGFDATGTRLGYGGGFYDRTLGALRKSKRDAGKKCQAIGIAYSAQEVDSLPRADHDEPLDWVVTETGSRALSGSKQTRAQGDSV